MMPASNKSTAINGGFSLDTGIVPQSVQNAHTNHNKYV